MSDTDDILDESLSREITVEIAPVGHRYEWSVSVSATDLDGEECDYDEIGKGDEHSRFHALMSALACASMHGKRLRDASITIETPNARTIL